MRSFLFTLCLVLGACNGWEPVYVTTKDTASPEALLGQIHLEPVYNVPGHNLYNNLLDQLAKFDHSALKKYLLTYSIEISSRNQTTFTDGSASVIMKSYNVHYALHHGRKTQTFTSSTIATTSHDNSPYSNLELDQKADEQAMSVLASTMLRRLAVFLRNHPQW